MGHFLLENIQNVLECMGFQVVKNEGFGDFWEGWIPFLLDIQAKSWMVGRYDVVVFQDMFTKWLMVYAVPDQKME